MLPLSVKSALKLNIGNPDAQSFELSTKLTQPGFATPNESYSDVGFVCYHFVYSAYCFLSQVSILFCYIADFSKLVQESKHAPQELLRFLHMLWSEFDALADLTKVRYRNIRMTTWKA